MIQITLSEEITGVCPDLHVLAIACRVRNSEPDAGLWEEITREEAAVRAEMKLIAKDGGQLSPPAAAATPVAPTNKLPPETPYAARYSGKGRRIMFDDEFL